MSQMEIEWQGFSNPNPMNWSILLVPRSRVDASFVHASRLNSSFSPKASARSTSTGQQFVCHFFPVVVGIILLWLVLPGPRVVTAALGPIHKDPIWAHLFFNLLPFSEPASHLTRTCLNPPSIPGFIPIPRDLSLVLALNRVSLPNPQL